MNIEQERAEFEAWCDSNEYDRVQRLDGTGYNNEKTKRAWAAWQAGRADLAAQLAAQQVDERGALRELVAAVEAEVNPEWLCNSYHPALLPALDRARAALSAAQPLAAT